MTAPTDRADALKAFYRECEAFKGGVSAEAFARTWLEERDPATARLAELEAQLAEGSGMLEELHAIVWGECPSLLNEDSGGNGELDCNIREFIQRLGGGHAV